jgi:hypothetical protein
MTDRRRESPHAEVPRDATGRPDDRFDGTDSGPNGWDTPYPPVDPDAAPGDTSDAQRPSPEARPSSGTGEVSRTLERQPRTAVDGTSYETDGPDEPADMPQR